MSQRVRRLGLTACASIALGFTVLAVVVAVENYPAEDGLVLANGGLVGGDFVAFWVGGHLYENDRDRLYDLPYQSEVRARLLGPANEVLDGELPFVYPPLVAAAVAPLSRLPLQTAFWIFAGVALTSALGSLLLLARAIGLRTPLQMGAVVLFSLGFVPFGLNTILGGQFPWLGIAVLSLVSAAVLQGRDFAAGLAMSLSYYKPPLFLLLLLTLLFSRGLRFLGGFTAGAAVIMALTLAVVGVSGLEAYLSVVSHYTYGQDLTDAMALPLSYGMGLVALGVTILGSMKWTMVVLSVPFVVIGVLAGRCLRSGDALTGMTLIATATLAFSLQCNKYDLALLLVPMVLLMAWQQREKRSPGALIWASLGAFYFEFPFREVSIGGTLYNASWLFFLVLLGGLIHAALRQGIGGRSPLPSS